MRCGVPAGWAVEAIPGGGDGSSAGATVLTGAPSEARYQYDADWDKPVFTPSIAHASILIHGNDLATLQCSKLLWG